VFRRSGPDGSEPGDKCGTSFLSFSENSNVLRELCPTDECCTYIKKQDRWIPHFVDQHINDQSHCVFLPGGESLVDFVGSTERIQEDWPLVVEEINRRMGTEFTVGHVGNPNGHGNQTAGGIETVCENSLVKSYFNETTIFNIAIQYAMDIVRYGYM
jgi:hypothetical protein